jgi:hypothetical protein
VSLHGGHGGDAPDHVADGDPCTRCGVALLGHRSRHEWVPLCAPPNESEAARIARTSGPCAKCALPPERHYTSLPKDKRSKSGKKQPKRSSKNLETIVAFDGEGQTFFVGGAGKRTTDNWPAEPFVHFPDSPASWQQQREDWLADAPKKHLYTYLAAVNEHGECLGSVSDYQNGLSTQQCLDFFLSFACSRMFGFSIGYDLAKILRDMPDRLLYLLVRPDKRKSKSGKGQRPVIWRGYRFAYVKGRLTLSRRLAGGGMVSITLWDVWRFYSCSFVNALTDWQIGTIAELDAMRAMKERRNTFQESEKEEIETYCKDECDKLAKLVRSLISAHDDAEIPLTTFFGAGSTAGALLHKLGVKDHLAKPPAEMEDALARAFFGGRFEISQRGPVRKRCWNADISSAYPYELFRQPCLACGTWQHVVGPKEVFKAFRDCQIALVHAHCRPSSGNLEAWGVLPWRADKSTKAAGTIAFPRTNPGVWVFKDEYQAAERLSSGVVASEAWVYRTHCDHRPFRDLPELYRERVRVGKEGKGLATKLGMNACYGKHAQSVGSATYQSWVYAGNVTSGTRASLLRGAFEGSRIDPWDVLMLATDGVFGVGDAPAFPAPLETGTAEIVDKRGLVVRKPLGGWEVKGIEDGMHLIRPGIYFPFGKTDEKSVKARGVSKKILLENKGEILRHYEQNRGRESFSVNGVRRFVGLVTGIQERGKNGIVRSDAFGEWVEHVIDISYSPGPKRIEATESGRLLPWEAPPFAIESAPYDKAIVSAEALAMQQAEEILAEQPDGDFSERGVF